MKMKGSGASVGTRRGQFDMGMERGGAPVAPYKPKKKGKKKGLAPVPAPGVNPFKGR
jgi:hypothetical protein